MKIILIYRKKLHVLYCTTNAFIWHGRLWKDSMYTRVLLCNYTRIRMFYSFLKQLNMLHSHFFRTNLSFLTCFLSGKLPFGKKEIHCSKPKYTFRLRNSHHELLRRCKKTTQFQLLQINTVKASKLNSGYNCVYMRSIFTSST